MDKLLLIDDEADVQYSFRRIFENFRIVENLKRRNPVPFSVPLEFRLYTYFMGTELMDSLGIQTEISHL